jgi:phage terminase small subunit
MSALTPKQEHFARLVAEGKSQSDAYRDAYNSSGKIDSVNVNASKLMADAKIALRVQQLKDELAEKSLWTRLDSVQVLSKIAKGDDLEAKTSDRVNAVKALNSMHGWDKITVENTHRILDDGSHEW